MPNRSVALIVIAVCTACALIGFAFYLRTEGPIGVPADAFYFAAAVIVLLPYLPVLLRHMTRR